MRIAMVHRDLHQPARGGICTVYRSLAAEMAARGHAVTLVTQATSHPVTLDGVTVAVLPRISDLHAHRAAVARLLTGIKPDIVDCSTWEAEALAYLCLPRSHRAPVLVRGEFSAATLGSRELAGAERHLVRHADAVIAVSRYAARDLAAAYGIPPPAVIHNGVDLQRFRPEPPAPPTSGTLVTLRRDGRDHDRTPLPRALGSGRPVPPWTPDAEGRSLLVWVGKITPMKGWDRLELIIRTLRHIAAVTVVLGHSPAYCPVTISRGQLTVLRDLDDWDMPGLYRSADWLLSTSRWEGFGLAAAEAMACGTPVLLPDQLGTAPELLAADGGQTYRDPDHLATILTSQSPPEAALPAHFDWSLNAEATLARYHQLARY